MHRFGRLPCRRGSLLVLQYCMSLTKQLEVMFKCSAETLFCNVLQTSISFFCQWTAYWIYVAPSKRAPKSISKTSPMQGPQSTFKGIVDSQGRKPQIQTHNPHESQDTGKPNRKRACQSKGGISPNQGGIATQPQPIGTTQKHHGNKAQFLKEGLRQPKAKPNSRAATASNHPKFKS